MITQTQESNLYRISCDKCGRAITIQGTRHLAVLVAQSAGYHFTQDTLKEASDKGECLCGPCKKKL